MTYHQPVQYGPPPQSPKKRMGTGAIVAITIGSLVALCCVGSVIAAAVSGDKPTTAADSQPAAATTTGAAKPAAPAKTSDVAPVGTAVRDGKFEFVAGAMACGKKQIGPEKAQDQFCQIPLSVRNIGNDARTFSATSQAAHNAAGAKFEVDGVASLYANQNGESFLENINPGSKVTVVIVFDVASTVKLTTLELHDSPFSGGAKVAL